MSTTKKVAEIFGCQIGSKVGFSIDLTEAQS